MAWTYEAANLATSSLYQVRYLVGDIIDVEHLVDDEEINFALTQRPSIYGAAAMVCRSLAAKFSRKVDTVDKDLRTTYSSQAIAYAKMAVNYETQASVRSGGLPYAGGISVADKITNEQDPDRVPPSFTIDMDDNYLPVAPIGPEGTPSPSDSSDDGSDNV